MPYTSYLPLPNWPLLYLSFMFIQRALVLPAVNVIVAYNTVYNIYFLIFIFFMLSYAILDQFLCVFIGLSFY